MCCLLGRSGRGILFTTRKPGKHNAWYTHVLTEIFLMARWTICKTRTVYRACPYGLILLFLQPKQLTMAEIINLPPISQTTKQGQGIQDLLNPTEPSGGKTRTKARFADSSRCSFHHPIKFLLEENSSWSLIIWAPSLPIITELGVGVVWPLTYYI